jgi:hypothetical protein
MSEKLNEQLFELQQEIDRWWAGIGEFFGNEQFLLVAKLFAVFIFFGLVTFLIKDAIDERYRRRERELERAEDEALIDFANSNGPHRT